MRTRIHSAVFAMASLFVALPSCDHKLEFDDASRIVERRFGHERYNDGKSKWSLFEVLGPIGPYTVAVNEDYRGSGGQLGAEQSGTFTVANGSGSVSKKYGGIGQSAFMAIPVQNRDLQNAVIACHMVPAEEPEAQQAGAGQTATRTVFEPQSGDKPQPEAEGRSR